jgi:hypothetical protein
VKAPAAVHPLPEGEGWDLKFCRIVGDPSRKGAAVFLDDCGPLHAGDGPVFLDFQPSPLGRGCPRPRTVWCRAR